MMTTTKISSFVYGSLICFAFISCGGESTNEVDPMDSLISTVDSIAFTTEKIELKEGVCDKPDQSCITVNFEYPVFAETHSAGTPLNTWIRDQITTPDEKGNVRSQKEFAEYLITLFKNDKNAIGDDMMPWSVENIAGINFENKGLISLYVSGSSYTGGAHPNSFTSYGSFYKSNGKKITISEIVKDSVAFVKICEKHFRSFNGFSPETDLTEQGFEFGDEGFIINTNFYISDRSITFLYNNYEIGPYIMGSWAFSVPFADIQEQLTSDFKALIEIPIN